MAPDDATTQGGPGGPPETGLLIEAARRLAARRRRQDTVLAGAVVVVVLTIALALSGVLSPRSSGPLVVRQSISAPSAVVVPCQPAVLLVPGGRVRGLVVVPPVLAPAMRAGICAVGPRVVRVRIVRVAP